MKYRTRSLKGTILIIAFVFVCIAAADILGIGTMSSGIRVGYVSHEGRQSWSASYIMMDGTQKRTIRPENTPEIICVEVVTEDGSLSIEMKDADGHIIFDEDNIGTASFEVEVTGKVVVRIKADKHKGSFGIEAKE